MTKFSLSINNKRYQVEAEDDTPLLWVIRDLIGLNGTKFGCGKALCGACTIHLDNQSIRSCSTPVIAAQGKKITTIEGLSSDVSHPLQEAWVEHQVPQCGYCQSGQIMSAAKLLMDHPDPTDELIDQYMQGNICRCGTYDRIRKAIKTAAKNA